MELWTFLRILWRRWWLVAAPVLGVLAHLAVTYRPPPTTYQVVMRFAAGTVPAGLSVDYDRYYSWLTSEYIANGLADIARTRAFAEAVAARLKEQGISADPAAIQGAIVTDNAQSILVVYLTWAGSGGSSRGGAGGGRRTDGERHGLLSPDPLAQRGGAGGQAAG